MWCVLSPRSRRRGLLQRLVGLFALSKQAKIITATVAAAVSNGSSSGSTAIAAEMAAAAAAAVAVASIARETTAATVGLFVCLP